MTIKLLDILSEATKRDYKKEYKKYQSSRKMKKYRAELNKYNRKKGTYGNGDGKDASHKGGKIVGFESESKNRGRREKSRKKGSKRRKTNESVLVEKHIPIPKSFIDDIRQHLYSFPVNNIKGGTKLSEIASRMVTLFISLRSSVPQFKEIGVDWIDMIDVASDEKIWKSRRGKTVNMIRAQLEGTDFPTSFTRSLIYTAGAIWSPSYHTIILKLYVNTIVYLLVNSKYPDRDWRQIVDYKLLPVLLHELTHAYQDKLAQGKDVTAKRPNSYQSWQRSHPGSTYTDDFYRTYFGTNKEIQAFARQAATELRSAWPRLSADELLRLVARRSPIIHNTIGQKGTALHSYLELYPTLKSTPGFDDAQKRFHKILYQLLKDEEVSEIREVAVTGRCIGVEGLTLAEDTETLDMKYDLHKVYNEVNSKYFDGKLKPVPLGWDRAKSTLGKVSSVETRRRGDPAPITSTIRKMTISKMYNLTHEQFMSAFIHECIHVYMIQNLKDFSWIGGYHGFEFKELARQLTTKSGYRITIKHDTTQNGDLELHTKYVASSSKSSSPKPLMVALLYVDNRFIGTYGIIRQPNDVQKAVSDSVAWLVFRKWDGKTKEVRIFTSLTDEQRRIVEPLGASRGQMKLYQLRSGRDRWESAFNTRNYVVWNDTRQ